MTIIIITIAIVMATILMAAIDPIMFAIVDAQVKAHNMERKAALAMAEDACRCKACVKRIITENNAKEAEMYKQMIVDPQAFYAEIARSNGPSSMHMVWARAMVQEVNNAVKAAN